MLTVVLIIPVMLFSLAGCATVGHKLDPDAVAKIKQGETSKAQVIELIGSPDQVTMMPDGSTMWMYQYIRVAAKPQNFIPVVGLLAGGADSQSQFYMLTIGPDGIVRSITGSYGASESKTGLAIESPATIPDVTENKRPAE